MKKIICLCGIALLLAACGELERPVLEDSFAEYPVLEETWVEYPIPENSVLEPPVYQGSNGK